jgi:hypothetical protein
MTPENAVYLIASYEAGATIEALVEETGVSYRRVRETLLAFGVTLRPPMILVPPLPPGMVARYRNGASIRQLGVIYGHSYSQTRNMLRNAGVALRPRGAPR